jgi:AcrR family transcriptional regulator
VDRPEPPDVLGVAARREDRRVRRTRRQLREALLQLVGEKGYDRVTVQDVIDRADLSRATFYAHFRDKDHLLVSGLDELEEGLRDAMAAFLEEGERASGRAVGRIQALLEHVAAHRWLYRGSVGGRAETLLTRQLRRRLTALLRQHYQEMVDSRRWFPPVPVEVSAEFVVGAFLGVMWWWLEQEEPASAEQVVQMLGLLATPAIDVALGVPRAARETPGPTAP